MIPTQWRTNQREASMSGTERWTALLADKTTDFVLTCMILVVALLAAAWLIRKVDQWRRQDDTPACTPHDQLAELRRWLDEGLIEPEEYAKLREKLEVQLRASMGMKGREVPPEQLGQFLVPEEARKGPPPTDQPQNPADKA
ncbi:MAG: hypothetical protein KJS91_14265 [Planctomycetes bacterium]|jgi:hypothetical protein|nr:hypothetical protein [Planctomycetota bacterium]